MTEQTQPEALWKPPWLQHFEAGEYREALRESILSGSCFGAQMQAIAALVIAEAADKIAEKVV